MRDLLKEFESLAVGSRVGMRHTLFCGDYRELLASLPDESVDVVITDPPYGIAYQNPYTQTPHDVLLGDGTEFSYAALADECYRVLKPDSAFFAFTGWSVYPGHYTQVERAGFTMKEPLIGQKRPSGSTDLYGSFQSNCDWLLFAHKGRFRFRETALVKNKRAGTVPNKGRRPVPDFKTRFPSCWFGDGYPYSSENSAFQKAHDCSHPTIKGQEFVEWLIHLTTEPGETVLDPFVGSGTTAVAAQHVGRRFICGEIHKPFYEMAQRRLADARTEESP